MQAAYLYAYWKNGKRLRKRYIGKTIGDLLVRKVAKKADTTPTKMRKSKFIIETTKGEIWWPKTRLGLQSTSE